MIGDFKIDEEGDLVLGDQLTDKDGYLLYYVGPGESVMTTEPDENAVPVYDLEAIWGDEAELQLILARLKTEDPDWLMHDGIGANLSDLIGEPNTRETASKGIELIKSSLTYDDTYREDEIEVIAIPVSAGEIVFDIWIERTSGTTRYPMVFDLEYGILNYYEVKA